MKIVVIVLLMCGSALGGTLRCPADKPMVYCFVSPCQFANCAAYPYAECRSNYCGGCNADFYMKGVKVNCTEGCTKEFPVAGCFADPCWVSSCPAYPNAECRANYCGCHAEFLVDGKRVNCEPTCPPGVDVHYCAFDPCLEASCPADPQATCRVNFCGGCSAHWYRDDKKISCTL